MNAVKEIGVFSTNIRPSLVCGKVVERMVKEGRDRVIDFVQAYTGLTFRRVLGLQPKNLFRIFRHHRVVRTRHHRVNQGAVF